MAKSKLLFTPGPLTTSRAVKAAMMRDLGSRDTEFIAVVREIRARLLTLGHASADEYTTILMQGSGTFGIESVISTVIPPQGKLLVIINGAYGKRIAQIATVHKIENTALTYDENRQPNPQAVDAALAADPAITHVAIVHCETTSGIVNPIEAIGTIVKQHNRVYIVDAMSSFGAIPMNLAECGIAYLISSANKCVQGVPGFSFIIARRAALLATAGYARSISLDLLAQWRGLEGEGQFRFTPPTHALLAFQQALKELDLEGGVSGRAMRYRTNHDTLVEGMRALGFQEYVDPASQGYIITSFRYPSHPNFDFKKFYTALSAKGCVIYPGQVSKTDCFRIGHIGYIGRRETLKLLRAIRQTLAEMNLVLEKES